MTPDVRVELNRKARDLAEAWTLGRHGDVHAELATMRQDHALAVLAVMLTDHLRDYAGPAELSDRATLAAALVSEATLAAQEGASTSRPCPEDPRSTSRPSPG